MKESRMIYVCSPYRGEVGRNKAYARALTRAAIELNFIPVTPHLYLTECLNDGNAEERTSGLECAKKLLIRCDAMLVGCKYGVSEGMKAEIDLAREYGIPIIEKGLHSTYNCREQNSEICY